MDRTFQRSAKQTGSTTPPDIQPAERDLEIETSPPKKAEIKAAIATLRNNKAPGTDSLCAEVFKTDPETAAEILHPLFVEIWEKKNCLMTEPAGG